jgi:hypothetical protein
LLATALHPQNQQWSGKLTLPKENWLPAEPIIATLEFTNNSKTSIPFKWSGDFFIDRNPEACIQKDIPYVSAPPPMPGSVKTKNEIPKEIPGTIRRIDANLSRACSKKMEQLYSPGKHEICIKLKGLKGYYDESCVEYEIVNPTGVDKQAYEFIKAQIIEPDKWLEQYSEKEEESIRHAVLSKYPTSTYAGYVLCNGRSQFNDAVGYLQRAEKSRGERKNCKSEVETLLAQGPRLDTAQSYLINGSDFAYYDVLRSIVSWKLALLGKYDESRTECNNVIASNKSPIEVERCKEFIAYMEQKGYLKK